MMSTPPINKLTVFQGIRDTRRNWSVGKVVGLLGLVVACVAFHDATAFGQTWTLVNQCPLGPTSNMVLLPNGTVMVQGFTAVDTPNGNWVLLSPDTNGNYVAGSWSFLPPMNIGRYNFATWVIPNGNVVVAGGAEESGSVSFSDLEYFSPLLFQWTLSTAATSVLNQVPLSDAPSALLPSGDILFGDNGSLNTYLYTPATDTWTLASPLQNSNSNLNSPTSAGEAFTILPSGQVYTYPSFQNYSAGNVTPWAQDQVYSIYTVIAANGSFYVNLQQNGISASTGTGPSGSGTNILDGGNLLHPPCVWTQITLWNPSSSYAKNQAVMCNGFIYVCTTAGTSGGSPGPTGTGNIIDGSVTWKSVDNTLSATGNWNFPTGELYTPATQTWALTFPNAPILNSAVYATDLGPATVLPDGTVIQYGVKGSAIYSPATGTWATGTALPGGLQSVQAPGAMLPNGLYLFGASVGGSITSGPVYLCTYNYSTKQITQLNLPQPVYNDLFVCLPRQVRMLLLPNGHMLMTAGKGNIWDYNPQGAAPLVNWRPTVNNITISSPGTYSLQGNRLNGISSGAMQGCYSQAATNYPIVSIADSKGNVKYATTSNWQPGVSGSGSAAGQSCQFQVPGGLTTGVTYNLTTIVNGIPSAPATPFTVTSTNQASNVAMAYNSSTQVITLTGDNNNNCISITVKNQILTIAGSNNTSVTYNGNTAATQAIHFGTNVNLATSLTINATMNAGDDVLVISGANIANVNAVMGLGNDRATASLCFFKSFAIDGGPGSNTFADPGSVSRTWNIRNCTVLTH